MQLKLEKSVVFCVRKFFIHSVFATLERAKYLINTPPVEKNGASDFRVTALAVHQSGFVDVKLKVKVQVQR